MIAARRIGGFEASALFDRRVESEELCDGYADGCEGERSAEPGQKGTFWVNGLKYQLKVAWEKRGGYSGDR